MGPPTSSKYGQIASDLPLYDYTFYKHCNTNDYDYPYLQILVIKLIRRNLAHH